MTLRPWLILLALATQLPAQDKGVPTDAASRNARINWVNEPKPGTLPAGSVEVRAAIHRP